MEWRYLGHLQLLSKAVAVSAEGEISPQEEMANPQGMKLFAVRDMGFLKISCIILLCVECNHRRFSYFCRIDQSSGVRYSGRHKENLCASDLRSSELYAQVIRANYCTPYTPAHMGASITRTGRNG